MKNLGKMRNFQHQYPKMVKIEGQVFLQDWFCINCSQLGPTSTYRYQHSVEKDNMQALGENHQHLSNCAFRTLMTGDLL